MRWAVEAPLGSPAFVMRDFFEAALSFPTVLFSLLLVVLVVYWLSVLAGALDVDVLDADVELDVAVDGDGAEGLVGVLDSLGLTGVPVTVSVTMLVTVGWFVSLCGTALLDPGPIMFAVLLAAIAVGLLMTRALVRPLRRAFREDPSPTRADLVGRVCVVRTTRVDHRFGQAEVISPDGSSAVVQVRVAPGPDGEPLHAGTPALIYSYEADGEYFLISPVDADLDPRK